MIAGYRLGGHMVRTIETAEGSIGEQPEDDTAEATLGRSARLGALGEEAAAATLGRSLCDLDEALRQ